jgi:hypothetical protein
MGNLTATEYYEIIIDDPVLTKHGFTKFSLPLNGKGKAAATKMVVHNTDKSKMMYPTFYKYDLGKTVKSLRDKIISDGILVGDDTANGLVAYFRNAGVLLSEDEGSPFFKNGNGKSKKSSRRSDGKKSDKKEEKSKPSYTAYKYSNNGKVALHESIILAGRPAFIAYENGKLQPYSIIEEDTRVIKPPHPENYPYTPYEFANMDEVLKYRDRALSEDIDSLYSNAKQIANDYNDQRKEKIRLLAIEIIASYFQDRFPTTHYDIVTGGNGSGKSTYDGTYAGVGYRAVNLTDPNAANINRILGCIEAGQCIP